MGYMYNDNSDTGEMYLSWNLLFFLKYTNNILLFCRTDFSDALVDSKILQSLPTLKGFEWLLNFCWSSKSGSKNLDVKWDLTMKIALIDN